MSAPVTERGRMGARTATIPAQRETGEKGYGSPAPPPEQKSRQRSAGRAYARRDDRLRRLVGGRPARTTGQSGRPQFVLLVMVLLAIGLVATLWLSTAAAADSYGLQAARDEALSLSQQAERLHREVAMLESPPELARRAAEMGMVPVQDPARLVVAPDGQVSVVGEPRAATGPPPSPPASPPPAGGADPAQPADPANSDLAADEAGGASGNTPDDQGNVVAQGAGDPVGTASQAAPPGQAAQAVPPVPQGQTVPPVAQAAPPVPQGQTAPPAPLAQAPAVQGGPAGQPAGGTGAASGAAQGTGEG